MPDVGTSSDYLADMLLDAACGDGTFTEPTNLYLALCTVTPVVGDTGSSITEAGANWTNYGRVLVAPADLSAAAGRSKTNSAEIDFGTATTTANETIVGWALVDASSGGNALFVGDFNVPIIVQDGNPVKVPVGALDLHVDPTKNAAP